MPVRLEGIQRGVQLSQSSCCEMSCMSPEVLCGARGFLRTVAHSLLQKQRRLLKKEEQLARLRAQATDKEENKQVALGTAKLNYLDPRISIAWCKRFGVPIEKIYSKTQRERFAWAFERADENFEF
ncbi:DNA topoisomerase I, mitochondrial [Microtus ochrogaster]|uniref:DNA topoisomerase I, mitochondrial n=1 Tax=Microtus ochrogaster TaxID=79684 RepID=A0A8J6GX21_MICOH|nr:DNA topoisomerase I, mitochondrial [Microtus ochrogaster]